MVGIVLLNYNTYQDTIKLVENLQHQTLSEELHIVVVDNASPNSSFKKLEPLGKQFKNVTVLQTGENSGYAKGNNFGLDYLKKNINPQYVGILNNDILLENDCFERLIAKMQQLENSAIISPRQLDLDNKDVTMPPLNSFLMDCFSLFFLTRYLLQKSPVSLKDNTGLKAMKVDMIPGSFMFSKFETFEKIGFFYPNTFLFGEERFIAHNVKSLGLSNYILLDQTYIHAHSKTINSVHNQVNKYRMLYDSWLKFTFECRKNPKLKTFILRNLMKISLLEISAIAKLKSLKKA